MAFASRIKVTTATTGTGALTLGATGVRDATNGDYLAPAEALSELANRSASYTITSGANHSRGVGVVSSNGLTLTRDANERSWNGTTWAQGLLNLAGTSTVILAANPRDLSAANIGKTLAIRAGAFLG